jgi:large conductance mechanosensitive channel
MKTNSFLNDFKAFAMKGNLIDMAVGVVIGGAFGKIVSSLVADVIMPLVGLLVGGVDFTSLKWTIKEATVNELGETVTEAATLNYGNFIQTMFDFIVIAFSIFVFLRIIFNLSKKKEEEKPAEPAPEPAPSKEEVLLTEIRDLLKENASK